MAMLTLKLPVFVVEPHASLFHVNLLPGGAVHTRLTTTVIILKGKTTRSGGGE
mgnify:CR=1 FL=1